MRTIRFYRTVNGASPVEQFLDSLNGKQAQKVLWVLKMIEELPTVPGQYFKKLTGTDGLWEMRCNMVVIPFACWGFSKAHIWSF